MGVVIGRIDENDSDALLILVDGVWTEWFVVS
jgi:hypothetical protein